MDFNFKPTPHEEAAALIEGKPPLVKRIFMQLLPELRGRAFTVAGIQSANILQAIRDEVAAVPRGQKWNDSKAAIAEALEPYLGEGAEDRAELALRVNSYPAFSSAAYRTAHEDPVTTHLQYLHGDCAVPTPSHLALNGVVLPKGDPFWSVHTGPWGHLGCVCYFRTMSPDQVAEEKVKDEKRNPEDHLVIEGPALRKLNEGTLVRGSRAYDVSPPSDPNAFHWHPDNLRIDLEQLKQRYDPEVWAVFETFAKKETIDGETTVWEWLTERDTFAANPDRFRSPDLIEADLSRRSHAKGEPPLSFKEVAEARKWADAHMHPENLNLTDAERQDLITYQTNSLDLNYDLIHGSTRGDVMVQARHMDSAIAKSKVDRPMTVWRGGSSMRWHSVQVGDAVPQSAFNSTSLAENMIDFKEKSWVKINIPKGASALYMDKLAGKESLAEEAEILLPRNSKLLVKSVEIKGGVAYVEADLIL